MWREEIRGGSRNLGKSDPLLERCLRRQITSSHILNSVLLQYHYSALVPRVRFVLLGLVPFFPYNVNNRNLFAEMATRFARRDENWN